MTLEGLPERCFEIVQQFLAASAIARLASASKAFKANTQSNIDYWWEVKVDSKKHFAADKWD